jgi:hypothetical protein
VEEDAPLVFPEEDAPLVFMEEDSPLLSMGRPVDPNTREARIKMAK